MLLFVFSRKSWPHFALFRPPASTALLLHNSLFLTYSVRQEKEKRSSSNCHRRPNSAENPEKEAGNAVSKVGRPRPGPRGPRPPPLRRPQTLLCPIFRPFSPCVLTWDLNSTSARSAHLAARVALSSLASQSSILKCTYVLYLNESTCSRRFA